MNHPAKIGYELRVWQNNGWRTATVIKVTPKRVRVEWEQKNGKVAGCWFQNKDGFLGLNCQYDSPIWGAQLET